MTNEELYAIWANEASPWSTWSKPVLFATMQYHILNFPPQLTSLPSTSWAPPGCESTALIIDLPGAESVTTGLALANRGYRPVPLYNCCQGPGMLVDVAPIVAALAAGGALLANIDLPATAPPAFLLDSRRLSNSHINTPGRFDNRWCVVPQDLPSADFLIKMGINTIVLRSSVIENDLDHTLYRYQEKGIKIEHSHPLKQNRVPVTIPKPYSFKSLFYRWQVLTGLRRNSAGGFGAIIPDPSSSGSGWG